MNLLQHQRDAFDELALGEKWRCGNGRNPRLASSEFQQSFQISFTRVGEPYYFEIDHLLPRQPHARDQPGNRRVEPKDCTDNFFNQVLCPVATANVQQFVARNRRLEACIHRQEAFGQKNYGLRQAERDRRIYIGRKPKLSACANREAHLVENRGRFHTVCDRRRSIEEAAKSHQPEHEERESQHNSAEDRDADPFSDDLHARKMPVRHGGSG